MSRRLQNRVALVTGATGGIGSATCRELAAEGAAVVVTYHRNRAAAEELVDALPGTGHVTVHVAVDDSDTLAVLAETVGDRYGRLDLLVNNAGVTEFVDHDDLDGLHDALIDRIFRVNVRGALACIRALEDLLRAADDALIVNMSSIAARTGHGSNVAYCASKAALDSVTRSLGRALAPGIRVVSVAPGLVQGDYSDRLDASWTEAQKSQTPLGRLATAEDVARAIVAVATDLTFTTGCILPVDGGRPLT